LQKNPTIKIESPKEVFFSPKQNNFVRAKIPLARAKTFSLEPK